MIPKVHVHYISHHETGTYGVMIDNDGLPFAVTLQPKDKFLTPGVYDCERTTYHKGGYFTFEVIVDGHSRILFHRGNHQEDSLLCFLVGECFELVDGKYGIAQSSKGFNEFWARYRDSEKIQLVVTQKEGI